MPTLLCLSLGLFATGVEPPLQRYAFHENHMGTRFQLILYASDKGSANRASQAAFGQIAELDAIMSDYRPASELMRLCKLSGGKPVPVSADLFAVLAQAQDVAKRSDGAFDVTVGPLTRLWRRSKRTGELPQPDELKRAMERVGYAKMKLDPQTRAVQLNQTGMQLDLGGIAKGYAADAALEVLKKQGINRALVAAGGDIAVSGPPPDAEGWTVAIQPLKKGDKPERPLLLRDAAVSTSGDLEQFAEIAGKRYSHILDPKTGLGLTGRMSVTVVAKNGATADPWTKVIAVLGPERGLPLLEAMDGTAVYGLRLTEKGPEKFESKRFKEIPRKMN